MLVIDVLYCDDREPSLLMRASLDVLTGFFLNSDAAENWEEPSNEHCPIFLESHNTENKAANHDE